MRTALFFLTTTLVALLSSSHFFFAHGFSWQTTTTAASSSNVGRPSLLQRTNRMNNVNHKGIQHVSLLVLQGFPRGGGGGGATFGSGNQKNKKAPGATELNQSRTPYNTESKCPVTGAVAFLGSLWGTVGVLYILAKAIKRVLPIALEPFQEGVVPLSQFELGAYIVTCLWFAYVEGFKGFQQKFSPLVVTRSFTLIPGKNGTQFWHYLLAPLYSMGLIHATRKRQIVSWSVTLGVAAIVAAVKQLPYPWRNIVDAGVVVGLSWGSLSILALYLKSWMMGQPPKVDAALPTK